jgi:hypothetical protein
MTEELLGFLVSLNDLGADDSIEEHLAIRDEMARRAIARSRGWRLPEIEAGLYVSTVDERSDCLH